MKRYYIIRKRSVRTGAIMEELDWLTGLVEDSLQDSEMFGEEFVVRTIEMDDETFQRLPYLGEGMREWNA